MVYINLNEKSNEGFIDSKVFYITVDLHSPGRWSSAAGAK
jgi:hypothetical protein